MSGAKGSLDKIERLEMEKDRLQQEAQHAQWELMQVGKATEHDVYPFRAGTWKDVLWERQNNCPKPY